MLLGVSELEDEEDRQAPQTRRSGTTVSDFRSAAAARNRARLAAARGEGPMPEAEPMNPAAAVQLQGMLQ